MDFKFTLSEKLTDVWVLSVLDETNKVATLKFTIVNNPKSMWKHLSNQEYETTIGLDKYIYLNRLFIIPEYRRNNLGTRLMNGLIKIVELKYPDYKILLEVDAFDGNISHENLIKFYESFGFKIIEPFNNVMIK